MDKPLLDALPPPAHARAPQSMMAAPVVNLCPPGSYVVEIYARPSMM